jgi:UDP-3-O-acyl-N-acetylglucosamine deacetylase
VSALDKQVSGDHYKDLKIQPIEYIHANGIPFAEGSVIKYVSRWRAKGGIKDLEKAKHFIELLIELELKAEAPAREAMDRLNALAAARPGAQ